MSEMTLTLAPAMEDYLRERVAAGDFVDPAEYVRELIRADQRSLADLRAAIDEGLVRDDSDRTVDQIFNEVLARRRDGHPRAGWAEAAALISPETDDEAAWRMA